MSMPFAWDAALFALAAIVLVAVLTWMASIPRGDVSIVDSLWALMILLGAWWYFLFAGAAGPRAEWLLPLATVWALRLSGYITWRNHGQGEDRRYQEMRARNQPHFTFKSLYLVFLPQAVLAWLVALPLMAGMASMRTLSGLDMLGVLLALFGIVYAALADWQLARFKADQANAGLVMDRGLWRYSRHPNYFGECCVWWGVWLLALSAEHAWTVISPVLMTFLLLKVSGVALLEKDIAARRPAYTDYCRRTNAFLPGLPRKPIAANGLESST